MGIKDSKDVKKINMTLDDSEDLKINKLKKHLLIDRPNDVMRYALTQLYMAHRDAIEDSKQAPVENPAWAR